MKRFRVLLSLAAMMAALVPAGLGRAAQTPDHPSVFASFRQRLKVGTEYTLNCTATNHHIRSIFFVQIERGSRGFAVAYDPLDGTLARFSVAGNETEIIAQPDSPVSGTISFESSVGGLVGANVIVSLAWGVWGDPLDCKLFVEGVEQPTKSQPLERGIHLSVTDYDGGVGVLTAASAALAQSYEMNASGTLFAWMLGGAGVGTATGPEAQSYRSVGAAPTFLPFLPLRPISLTIAEETSGKWTFGLPAAAGAYESPSLWILNVDDFAAAQIP